MIAVVIPSKTASNLIPCVEAVRKHEPDARIIIVDDGLPPMVGMGDCDFVSGVKPFIYARNCNLGIQLALYDSDCEGVILLNDDALLETPGGFSVMAQACREHPEYGLIGATTKIVGNPNQFPKGIGLRDENRMVCFFCVYIPRTTIDRVGLLDPRFVDYGMDDDDYSFEVRKAGLKIGVHDGCYVDHGSLKSSFRGDPKTPADFRPNLKRFIEKWGHDNWGRPV
jgi:GT2 family glycosyltransferase